MKPLLTLLLAASALLPLLTRARGGIVPPAPPAPMPAELAEVQLEGLYLIPETNYKELTGKDQLYRVLVDLRLVNRSRRAVEVSYERSAAFWCGPATVSVSPAGGQALQAEPIPMGNNAPGSETARLRRGKSLYLNHLSHVYHFADMQGSYAIQIEGRIRVNGVTYAYSFSQSLRPQDAVSSFEALNAARKKHRN